MAGSRAVVQGFGKVGGPLAFLLSSAGMRVVAVSDIGGAVLNEGGLDINALSDHVAETGSVAGFAGGDSIGGDALWDVECELLVPAALGGCIDDGGRQADHAPTWSSRPPTGRPRSRPSPSSTTGASWSCPTSWPTPAA